MTEEDILVVAANSPLKSLAASKHQKITIEKEIKADSIVSQYYLVIKAN
jgi:hypothetical protein